MALLYLHLQITAVKGAYYIYLAGFRLAGFSGKAPATISLLNVSNK